MSTQYRLVPNVKLLPFESGNRNLSCQVVSPSARIACNGATEKLLRFLDAPRDLSELVAFCEQNNIRVPAGGSIDGYLEQTPLRYFVKPYPMVEGAGTTPQSRKYLHLKLDCFPAWIVTALSRRLTFMFSVRSAFAVGLFIIVAHTCFLVSILAHHQVNVRVTGKELALAWCAVYVALLCHEIGHCAACSRYGARTGSIGIGFYLVWPVLYADISDCWTLSRLQRVVTNLAGIYFHLVASSLTIIVFFCCKSALCSLIVQSIVLSTLLNLSPVGRFDGYWILVDVIGTPNLQVAMSDWWKCACGMFRGHNLWNRSRNLTISGRALGLLSLYTLMAIGLSIVAGMKVICHLSRSIYSIVHGGWQVLLDPVRAVTGFHTLEAMAFTALSLYSLALSARSLIRRAKRAASRAAAYLLYPRRHL